MEISLPITSFSQEQNEVWKSVNRLWELSQGANADAIRPLIHPRYVGWDITAPMPHLREAAVHSVAGDAHKVAHFVLQPLSVEVYGQIAGVVHYAYSASVVTQKGDPLAVTGKWTEVYIKQAGDWLLAAVSGRPDPAGKPPRA
jgi:hypothetical protein